MQKPAVVAAGVAAAVVWLLVLALLAVPALTWWQDRLNQPPTGAPGAPTTPAATPARWRFSILDTPQQSFDRLPRWVQSQSGLSKEAVASARMVAQLSNGRVYLTGTHQGGCLIVTDELARSTGSGCGNWRPPSVELSGSTSTAEPCGVIVVLVPDGYTGFEPTVPQHLIAAHGRNGIVFINSPSLPDTSLVGPGQPPLPTGLAHLPRPSPNNSTVGC